MWAYNATLTTIPSVNNTSPSNLANTTSATTTEHSTFAGGQCCNWYGLYYYLVVFVISLTSLCIILVKMTLVARRNRLYRRLAVRQRAQANGNQGCGRTANANTNVCFTTTVTPKTDAPPAYEDVVQNYIDAKQQLQAAEEGAIGGGNPLTVSTTTLETVLESGSSAADLNAITSTNRTTTTTDLNHNHIV